MKKVDDILKGIQVLRKEGPEIPAIEQLVFDSRKAGSGTAFVAIRGTHADGHAFIPQAIGQGTRMIICEQFPERLHPGIQYIQVDNTARALGFMASNFYENPSLRLKLIGITGTNGKTTIATLLYRFFLQSGYRAGLISTIEYYINKKSYPSTHTTPDPLAMNKLLHEMVEAGCEYCFMEVSSHGISQERITGLRFAGGVFTNLTHDHLDYHPTFRDYLMAKKRFFDGLPQEAFALTNADDKNGLVMVQNTAARKYTYSLKSLSDFRCRIIENTIEGLQLEFGSERVWFRLTGEFNAYNILAVHSTALLLGMESTNLLTRLSPLSPVAGRFETLRSADGVVAIIDYAHTPDALLNVLRTIHTVRPASVRVITVVGAGGDRDRAKRPVMARIACSMSDRVILTSDNPRSEDPQVIIDEMRSGIEPEAIPKVLAIADRREAIRTASALAEAGDIVLIAGKGHEHYQEIKGIRHHFDDKEEIKAVFALRSANPA